MALLGTPLLVLLGIVTVLAPVATYLLWSRLRGPRAVRTACRVSLLLSSQLAAVLLVAAAANDYGDFYTSWSDLLGWGSVTTAGATQVTVGGRGTDAAGAELRAGQAGQGSGDPVEAALLRRDLRVEGVTSFSTPSQYATRGQVLSVALSGPGSHLSAPGYVYLPPQYFRAAWAHRSFPPVEVLTGYPGSALAAVGRIDEPGRALEAVQRGQAAPMVYVYFRSAVVSGRDTECTDVPGGPQALTFLARDVPRVVDAVYRVSAVDWGVMGDSTGGYCAAKMVLTYPQTFRSGVALSGYYYALSDITTGRLWGGSLARRDANDPEWLVSHRPTPPVSLLVTISRTEKTYPDTMRFLHLVHAPLQVSALILAHGGHNFQAWEGELPAAFNFLTKHLG